MLFRSEDIESKVRREVRRYDVDGDVAIGVSGGKDSSATLNLLSDIFGEWRDLDLYAVCVDEGITPYRDKGLRAAGEAASAAGVELDVVDMEDRLGISVEDVDGDELTTCGYCGVFRRKLLNDRALELGAEWVATGHNLDDEAQSVLMNVLRGDGFRLSVQGETPRRVEGMLPRMKPLRGVPEREVALYVELKGLPAHIEECPFAEGSFRSDVRSLLNRLESSRPGTKYSVASLPSSLDEDASMQLDGCDRCGYPSSRELCQTCRFLESGVTS